MAQIGRKIKSAQNLLKSGTFDILNMRIWILISKMVFIKYLPPVRPKIKSTNSLLKFGTINISNIPTLTTKSDKSFIEQLLHVMPKLFSEFEFQTR